MHKYISLVWAVRKGAQSSLFSTLLCLLWCDVVDRESSEPETLPPVYDPEERHEETHRCNRNRSPPALARHVQGSCRFNQPLWIQPQLQRYQCWYVCSKLTIQQHYITVFQLGLEKDRVQLADGGHCYV